MAMRSNRHISNRKALLPSGLEFLGFAILAVLLILGLLPFIGRMLGLLETREEQKTLASFEALAQEARRLAADEHRLVARKGWEYFIDHDAVIVGFDKGRRPSYDNCGPLSKKKYNTEEIKKPPACGEDACLCYFRCGYTYRYKFNENCYPNLVGCERIPDIDYIFTFYWRNVCQFVVPHGDKHNCPAGAVINQIGRTVYTRGTQWNDPDPAYTGCGECKRGRVHEATYKNFPGEKRDVRNIPGLSDYPRFLLSQKVNYRQFNANPFYGNLMIYGECDWGESFSDISLEVKPYKLYLERIKTRDDKSVLLITTQSKLTETRSKELFPLYAEYRDVVFELATHNYELAFITLTHLYKRFRPELEPPLSEWILLYHTLATVYDFPEQQRLSADMEARFWEAYKILYNKVLQFGFYPHPTSIRGREWAGKVTYWPSGLAPPFDRPSAESYAYNVVWAAFRAAASEKRSPELTDEARDALRVRLEQFRQRSARPETLVYLIHYSDFVKGMIDGLRYLKVPGIEVIRADILANILRVVPEFPDFFQLRYDPGLYTDETEEEYLAGFLRDRRNRDPDFDNIPQLILDAVKEYIATEKDSEAKAGLLVGLGDFHNIRAVRAWKDKDRDAADQEYLNAIAQYERVVTEEELKLAPTANQARAALTTICQKIFFPKTSAKCLALLGENVIVFEPGLPDPEHFYLDQENERERYHAAVDAYAKLVADDPAKVNAAWEAWLEQVGDVEEAERVANVYILLAKLEKEDDFKRKRDRLLEASELTKQITDPAIVSEIENDIREVEKPFFDRFKSQVEALIRQEKYKTAITVIDNVYKTYDVYPIRLFEGVYAYGPFASYDFDAEIYVLSAQLRYRMKDCEQAFREFNAAIFIFGYGLGMHERACEVRDECIVCGEQLGAECNQPSEKGSLKKKPCQPST